jgi:hypothetical protein
MCEGINFGGAIKAYRILVKGPEVQRQIWKLRCSWKGNIVACRPVAK